MSNIIQTLNQIENGNIDKVYDVEFCTTVTNIANSLINNPYNWNAESLNMANAILRASNSVYNNTSLDTLLIDDGIYDQLIVIYQNYDPNYQVGAIPTSIVEAPQNEILDQKLLCVTLTDDERDSKLYINDILDQRHRPIYARKRLLCVDNRDPISKRLINTQHKYPELVGTLDKCKFVLNADAISKGVYDKPSIQVFERDFIHKALNAGVINPNETFNMIGELKYDGISVEAEVYKDKIITALSRGDTASNIATDLTPILAGYKFHNASNVPIDEPFGIKFEAVITRYDLEHLGMIRGKSYKNCRNAIIGLFGSSDAYRFVDHITLIPIATSLDMDRVAELNFLNHYYNSGEYNRFIEFSGNYQEILFKVKQFTESAEIVRKMLPYMIDGVVISFTDKQKIAMLGRQNSVNKYQMAIKFNPSKVRTNFIGYTYSIGKSGDIIPMVHFKPCEFIGTIHTKQTIHSYERFKTLNLAFGDQIDIEYVNDVLTYVTKPDTEFNRNNTNAKVKFIEKCPCCGSTIEISATGKTAKCPNINCQERKIMRMVDMISQFGFKDFSEETVRALNITSVAELLNCKYNGVPNILGPLQSAQFVDCINKLLSNPIEDYKLMSALSFDGMAEEKWKLILKHYTIPELMILSTSNELSVLESIPGIGSKIIQSIKSGLANYIGDLQCLLVNCKILSFSSMKQYPKVAITGFRDPEFIDILNKNGFDASDKYGVTKSLHALITEDKMSTSGKMANARKYGIPIYTKEEFLQLHGIIL